MKKKYLGLLALTATATVFSVGLTPKMDAQAQTLRLPSHTATVPINVMDASKNLGAANPTQTYTFGVVVPSKDMAGLAAFSQAVGDKSNAQYHHFLTRSQAKAKFGPDDGVLTSIESHLTQAGFKTNLTGEVLFVTGTVGQVNNLFGTQLTQYSNNKGTYVSPNGTITIPSWLRTATGLTGLVKRAPKPQSVTTSHVSMQYAPLSSMNPTPSGSTVTAQSGPFQVTVQRVTSGSRAPGEAVRYLVTSTLNGQPDPNAVFAGLSGPFKGAGSFVMVYPNPQAGQNLVDFTFGEAQQVSMALTMSDGTNSATVQLPTASFVGPSTRTTSISSIIGGGSGNVVAPWNPASNSLNEVFHAQTVVGNETASVAQGKRPSIGVFTVGGIGVPSTDAGAVPVYGGYLSPNSFSIPESDAASFSAKYGLTPENYTVDYIGSDSVADPGYYGFEGEMSLDLQMMETSAPGANIHVYSAGDFNEALNAVVKKDDVSVFSISYGEGDLDLNTYAPGYEASWDLLAQVANAEGITIVVSAGDDAGYSGAQDVNYGVPASLAFAAQPSFPASSSYVTAIGGTEDSVTPSGSITEAALWGGNLGAELPKSTLLQFLSQQNMMGAGGISSVEPAPYYQKWLNPGLKGRMVPDVSLPASVVTPGYFGFFDGMPSLSGGTSAGAPLFAGWVADLALSYGTGLGNINPVLYATSRIHGFETPVAFGNNGAYSVTKGDNAVTGLGQPSIDSFSFK